MTPDRAAEVKVLRDLETTLTAVNRTKTDLWWPRRLWLAVQLGMAYSVVEAWRRDIEDGGVLLREIAREAEPTQGVST